MNLWPVEHFFEHICHHFWVGLLLPPVQWVGFYSDFLQNPYFKGLLPNIYCGHKEHWLFINFFHEEREMEFWST